jgi:hypothetical protein
MTIRSEAYSSFNRWLIFAGLMLFGGYLAYQEGLIRALITSDRSYLSLVILLFFVAATLHVGILARRLGVETAITAGLATSARKDDALFEFAEDGILVDREPVSHSYAHEHLAFLAEKCRAFGRIDGQDLLLDRLDNRIRRGHETGWFIADLMVRLGLLGTVIGFIFMLGSISTITTADLQALQQLLSNMSEGMRVALYTTLSGLTAGILLSFQYQLLDQGADRLLSDIIELSEVHAIGHLRRCVQCDAE